MLNDVFACLDPKVNTVYSDNTVATVMIFTEGKTIKHVRLFCSFSLFVILVTIGYFRLCGSYEPYGEFRLTVFCVTHTNTSWPKYFTIPIVEL